MDYLGYFDNLSDWIFWAFLISGAWSFLDLIIVIFTSDKQLRLERSKGCAMWFGVTALIGILYYVSALVGDFTTLTT